MAISTKLAATVAALNGYGNKVSTSANKWSLGVVPVAKMIPTFAQPDQPFSLYYEALMKPGIDSGVRTSFCIDTQAVFDSYMAAPPLGPWPDTVQYFVIRETGETWKCSYVNSAIALEPLGNYQALDVIPALSLIHI